MRRSFRMLRSWCPLRNSNGGYDRERIRSISDRRARASPSAPHIQRNPEWQLAIDQDPQMAVETRKKIFDRAVVDKGTHGLMPNVGRLA
jgi:hypothetical protein